MKKLIVCLVLLLAVFVSGADRLIKVGSTDVTLQVPFYNATNGALYSSFADLNDLDVWFIRVETDEDVTISTKTDMNDLTSLAAVHYNDGVEEIGRGYYRVDVNDAALAAGATTATVIIEDANNTYILPVQIDIQLVDFDPYSTITNIETDTAAQDTTTEIRTLMTGSDTTVATQAKQDTIIADTNEAQVALADGGNIESLVDNLPTIEADTNEVQVALADGGNIESFVDNLPTIEADTNELQADQVDGGRLDLIWDATLADSNELQQALANGGAIEIRLDGIDANLAIIKVDVNDVNTTVEALPTVPSAPGMR